MSDGQSHRRYDKLAQKWRDLAERRRDHIIELYQTGRWKHYYTEQELIACLREAIAALEVWDALAESGRRRMIDQEVPPEVPRRVA
ncbi:MAG: TIGR03809 family protein [Pseudorhodoplanes sp.]